jgi:4-amino-4-deoxy-L-arabinose transferase-like glycosyltransferase
VAILNAACWSLITPAFQVPDEQDHFAYVKQLAETGSLPTSSAPTFDTNREVLTVLSKLRYFQVRQQPQNRTISSAGEQEGLQQALGTLSEEHLAKGSYAAGVASSEPPLYYALETVPYSLAGNMLTRLQLMRLLSALMAGVTALFVFLFVRESLPGVPWAWTVGGLGVALVPLFGFMSGAVNPDALLFAVSAAAFYLLARGFRRGLKPGLAIAIGTITALGLLTKLNFIGLVPGIALGLVVLAVRAARVSRRSAFRSLALACAIAAGPVVLYALLNLLAGRHVLGTESGTVEHPHLSLRELGYIWQLYLPRLPGMTGFFPALFPARQLWFRGYVGLYGWLDTPFPGWVYDIALVLAACIAALCLRTIVMSSSSLRARAGELSAYALMSVGLMGLIGASSYLEYPATTASFAQARYLLPLLPLLGAVLAMAARGAGRRLGPPVGAAIVVLFLAHDLFSQLLVVSRFYG